jgi:signal transduction histidine kinase
MSVEIGESTAIGRKLPATRMSRTAVTVRGIVGIAGLVLLAVLLLLNPPSTTRFFVLFALAMVASELFLSVRVGPGAYFSVSSTFLFVFFLLSGGIAAAVLDATCKLLVWLSQRLLRRHAPTALFALFSIGQAILSSLAAAFVVQLISPRTDMAGPISVKPLTSLVLFAIVYLVVSSAVSSLAVIARGFSEIRSVVLTTTGFWTGVSLLTAVPFAVIMALIGGAIGGFPRAAALVFLMLAGISFVMKLNVRLREGNDELKTINRIGTLLNATLDLSALFRILARESGRVLQWDGFFIALVEKDSPHVQLIFMTGAGDEITTRTIGRGKGLTGKALETGEMIFYERPEGEALEDDELRGQRRARSIVVAPMKFNEEIIGAISLQSFQTDVYGRSQMRLLQTIANQAAIAVRNAQLFTSEQTAKNERDEFLSLVTHEIKNPLTSIKGYTELAEHSIRSADVEGAADALHVIRDESARILRLAEDLLEASRAAAGKFSVRMEQVDLRTIVQQIVSKYSATSQRQLRLDCDPTVPSIEGDPVRLAQVVENLVSNALKYSPEGTPVTVGLRSDERLVRLTVQDQGAGIASEKLPLIFERFYRIEEEGNVIKGTGLGLFITREIVRMHGGTIDVESVVDAGSTFIVQLPRPTAA